MTQTVTVKIDKALEPLIPDYLKDITRWLQQMKDASEKGDFNIVRDLSHKMTGTGSGYGFDFITNIGTKLNKGAHEENATRIIKLCDELRDTLERVVVEYFEEDDDEEIFI
ncbi:MAG: hypothetical protein HQK61_07550 [Desulfamplus sp.]|nr:hypothetical protein [Desulfamplus sp.]